MGLARGGAAVKLENNRNTLNQIQKPLNEYLDGERAKFARFYFIGDDDLLEIIGNRKDPKAMNRHLSKMFAGIAVDDVIVVDWVSTYLDNGILAVAQSSSSGETPAIEFVLGSLQTPTVTIQLGSGVCDVEMEGDFTDALGQRVSARINTYTQGALCLCRAK